MEEVTQETAEPGSVAGLCVQAYRLWVLRQQADKLSLAVYTICVEQDNEVKVSMLWMFFPYLSKCVPK